MKRMLFGIGALCLLAAGCNQNNPPASSNQVTTTRPPAMTAPADRSNTAVNQRDRDNTNVTPTKQSEDSGDIHITADIRKRVVAADMSVDAHNVKIVTQNGKVTLRGPVATAQEKKEIEQIAANVAGAKNVDDELEVNHK